MGRPLSKSAATIAAVGIANNHLDRNRRPYQQQQQDEFVLIADSYPSSDQQASTNNLDPPGQQLLVLPQQLPLRHERHGPCKPPLSRKFGHPCNCGPMANYYRQIGPSSNQARQQQQQPATSNNNNNGSSSINNINYNNITGSQSSTANTNQLPPVAYFSPLYLYDPVGRQCLPTSRSRDMLLKECQHHTNDRHQQQFRSQLEPFFKREFAPTSSLATPGMTASTNARYGGNHHCYYDDLVCDSRRSRCVCKPTFHLYYDSTNKTSSFACVPIGNSGINCRPGYIYNVISRECQKIFDVNELPPNHPTGFSATQSSFVSIVLIWILLLIFSIVATKLGKLRNPNLYRNTTNHTTYNNHSPSASIMDRASSANSSAAVGRHRQAAGRAVAAGSLNQRQQQLHLQRGSTSSSAWLHPFLSAANGNQPSLGFDQPVGGRGRRINSGARAYSLDNTLGSELGDRHHCDEHGNFIHDGRFIIGHDGQQHPYSGSQLSLNNPPPKFEEIYPSCQLSAPPPPLIGAGPVSYIGSAPPPPSNEDLPTYDEAIRLGKTILPDSKA